ncbi:unnamed protein product [Vicia faba]|uniref:Uncharacterized protein n=1 Tax=Vicia faba TaxID=3906 RepID=A0AAV1AZK2_VICFA|nr:unnamed protein product [Vicia faba]
MSIHNDNLLKDFEDISKQLIFHFKENFTTDNNCLDNCLVEETIPSLVYGQDNNMLTSISNKDEVRNAIFAMNTDGDPRSDGFGANGYSVFLGHCRQ